MTTRNKGTFVSICCLITTLLSFGIIVLFATQPQVLMEQTLPQNDVIYEPINESYAIAMETFGRQGNEELTLSMKRLQTEENCCLHLEPKQDGEKCIIISTNGDILRPNPFMCAVFLWLLHGMVTKEWIYHPDNSYCFLCYPGCCHSDKHFASHISWARARKLHCWKKGTKQVQTQY